MKYYTIPYSGKTHEISKARYISAIFREQITDMCVWYDDGKNVFIGDCTLNIRKAVTGIIEITKRFDLNAVQIGVTEEEYKVFEDAANFTKGGSITIIKDKYNSKKTWLIKRSRCRHYYLNQSVYGKLGKWAGQQHLLIARKN